MEIDRAEMNWMIFNLLYAYSNTKFMHINTLILDPMNYKFKKIIN